MNGEDVLHQIAQGVTPKTGDAFFWSLAETLVSVLGADHALISKFHPQDMERMQTLAFIADGERRENIEYRLQGSACDEIIRQQFCRFPVKSMDSPMVSELLQDLGAKWVVGTALERTSGTPVGTMVAVFRHDIEQPKAVENLLRIFASRAAAEVERLEQLECLQESERQLRSIYESSPLPYQSLDDEGCFLDVNPSWLDTFGYRRDEVLGQPFTAFMTESSAEIVRENFPVLKRDGVVRDAEFEMKHKDGRSVVAVLNGRSVYDERGAFQRTHCILHDVTDKTRLQEQRLRTGQLAAIGELAAGVAHEINNPITGVINYAQLIMNRAESDDDLADMASRIVKEGDRIATIVRQLLLLSRDESIEHKRIDLTETLADTLSLVGTQLHKEGTTLKVDLAETMSDVMGQPQQLQQLFLNILSNARYALNKKFPSGDPGKIIHVTLDQFVEADREVLRITIKDHGVGIPEELLPRIMQPFVTSKPSSEGTGLGLSICHEIIKKHQGQILVKSVVGEYTEVLIELMAVKDEGDRS